MEKHTVVAYSRVCTPLGMIVGSSLCSHNQVALGPIDCEGIIKVFHAVKFSVHKGLGSKCKYTFCPVIAVIFFISLQTELEEVNFWILGDVV